VQLADLAGVACAAALHVPGRGIKWAPETLAFPGKIVRFRPLRDESAAARIVRRRFDPGGEPREVPGSAWGGRQPFVEQPIRLGAAVLSFIVPRPA